MYDYSLDRNFIHKVSFFLMLKFHLDKNSNLYFPTLLTPIRPDSFLPFSLPPFLYSFLSSFISLSSALHSIFSYFPLLYQPQNNNSIILNSILRKLLFFLATFSVGKFMYSFVRKKSFLQMYI